MLFKVVTAIDVDLPVLKTAASSYAAQVGAGSGVPADETDKNLASFEALFARHGWECNLRSQLRNAAEKGFPPASAPVLALMALEATTGVLMGVQNLDSIIDFTLLDALSAPETFIGIRGKTVSCLGAELVVRDRDGIIASVFQGPDRRTAVGRDSRNLLFYVFDSDPSIGIHHAQAAKAVSTLLRQCSDAVTILDAELQAS